LKILHLASHEINPGDGALNLVIRERLSALADTEVEFTLRDVIVDRRPLTANDLDPFDLVVVGGGGFINNSDRAAQTGTELPIALAEYRRAKPRFAFVALGHNLFASQHYRHAKALSQLLAIAAERGDPFSVRNDGSLARMRSALGEACAGLAEVPDPGFFIGSPLRPPLEASTRPYALLQVAGDSLWLRLGGGQMRRVLTRFSSCALDGLAERLAQWGLRCWRDCGLDILVAPHLRLDVSLASAVLNHLYAGAGHAADHRPFRMVGTPYAAHARAYFSAYSAASLVVGMRGHAVICGVGLRRPVIALSTHPKIAGFMDDCGLKDWTVPLSHDMVDDLEQRSRALLKSSDSYFQRRDVATADFSDRLDRFLLRAVQSPDASACATDGTAAL
jgi:polysaccharide pyruvyl transferase WcaK-like protein